MRVPPFLFTFALYISYVMCRSIFAVVALSLMLSYGLLSCTREKHTAVYLDQAGVAWLDTVPTPSDLSSPEERAEYRLLHYWDGLVFTDETYTHDADFMSRVFDRYVSLVLKNRPGTPAADFTYNTLDGESSMRSLLGERPLILFFYNVPCHTCHRVMADIQSSETLSAAISAGKLSVLTVDKMGPLEEWTRSVKDELPKGWIHGYNYTDLFDTDLYNIKGVPTIYLLDKDGTVLIREASVASLEQWCLAHLSL